MELANITLQQRLQKQKENSNRAKAIHKHGRDFRQFALRELVGQDNYERYRAECAFIHDFIVGVAHPREDGRKRRWSINEMLRHLLEKHTPVPFQVE